MVVVAVVVLRATAVTALAGASEAEPSLSASPIEPCWHVDAVMRLLSRATNIIRDITHPGHHQFELDLMDLWQNLQTHKQ